MDKPTLKYTFTHYKFRDKRIGDTFHGYEDGNAIGVIVCPKCGQTVEVLKEVTSCTCGVQIVIKV